MSVNNLELKKCLDFLLCFGNLKKKNNLIIFIQTGYGILLEGVEFREKGGHNKRQ